MFFHLLRPVLSERRWPHIRTGYKPGWRGGRLCRDGHRGKSVCCCQCFHIHNTDAGGHGPRHSAQNSSTPRGNRDGLLPDPLQNCLTRCYPAVWQIGCSCFSSAMSLATAKPFVNKAEIVLLYVLHISLSGFSKENISLRMNPECKKCWFLQCVLVFIRAAKKNSRLCSYSVFSSSSAHNVNDAGCSAVSELQSSVRRPGSCAGFHAAAQPGCCSLAAPARLCPHP